MRAVKLYSTGDIRTVDVDVPSPAKNEILIKVEAGESVALIAIFIMANFPQCLTKS